MTKIFISYRRDDSQHMSGRIFDILVPNFGRENIYKDVDSIMLGQDFREEIKRLITSCDVALAVIGPRWVGDNAESGQRRIDDPGDFVRIEIEFCLARGIPIVPLLIDRYDFSRLHDLPTTMERLQVSNGIEIRGDPYFKNDMDIVIQRIKTQYISEEDKRQQELVARLAQIEKEKREAELRERVRQYDEVQQRKLEQQRLQEEEAAKLRQQQEEAAARLRQKQAEEAAKRQAEDEKKAKEKIVSSLEKPVTVPFASVAGLFEAGVIGYFAYWLWSTPMNHFGGAFLEVVLIALFLLVAAVPMFFILAIIPLAFTKTKVGAMSNLVSLVVIPIIVSFFFHMSNPVRTIVIILVSTLIQGIVSFVIYSIINDFKEPRLPWFADQSVSLEQRLMKHEVG